MQRRAVTSRSVRLPLNCGTEWQTKAVDAKPNWRASTLPMVSLPALRMNSIGWPGRETSWHPPQVWPRTPEAHVICSWLNVCAKSTRYFSTSLHVEERDTQFIKAKAPLNNLEEGHAHLTMENILKFSSSRFENQTQRYFSGLSFCLVSKNLTNKS